MDDPQVYPATKGEPHRAIGILGGVNYYARTNAARLSDVSHRFRYLGGVLRVSPGDP